MDSNWWQLRDAYAAEIQIRTNLEFQPNHHRLQEILKIDMYIQQKINNIKIEDPHRCTLSIGWRSRIRLVGESRQHSPYLHQLRNQYWHGFSLVARQRTYFYISRLYNNVTRTSVDRCAKGGRRVNLPQTCATPREEILYIIQVGQLVFNSCFRTIDPYNKLIVIVFFIQPIKFSNLMRELKCM